MLDAGFPPGVLTIDDRWSPDYGTWEFDTSTFADPTAMVQRPHELGFTVMLRLVPFVSPDIATFRYLRGRPRDGRCCGGSVLATTWADRCGARRGGMCLLLPAATLRVAAQFVADEVEWPSMDVVFEELTFCVGDGCVSRFADDVGCGGYCPECLALWDDHAAGRHDSPVDACRLCR